MSQASLAAKVAEMQFRIDELEFDVSCTKDLESRIETLKNDIQFRDWTIKAQDKDLVLAQKQAEEARVQVAESEKTLDRVLTNLTEANERKAALTARVSEMETEKDSLVAEKASPCQEAKGSSYLVQEASEEESSLQVQFQPLEETIRFGSLALRP